MDTRRYLRVSSSGEIVDRSGKLMFVFLNRWDHWCFPRDLDEFSPRLIQATVATEDERFYLHPGVDPLAVVRAAWQNLTQGRVVSGASTLTMQVVKEGNRRSRTLRGKLLQAVRALRIELRCSKDGILRTYLNTAPYGLNLTGAEAAARRFFGKPARELTLSEAALLAGLPKAPSALMPLRHPERALERRNYVLERMRQVRYITEDEFRRACSEALGVQWHPFPRWASHVATRLKPLAQERGEIRTTLDRDVQRLAEELVKRSIVRHRPEITNAALIAVDVPSATVIASVGSAGFFTAPGGQVDMCRARRSPGSALKPFTYALAVERNVLYACETLLDDSLDYGMYDPANYDGRYNGLVSASDALKHSLNVPAVTALGRVGAGNLYSFLRDAGLTTLNRMPEDYGLGLTLGNCEVRLDELAAAYCMIASFGKYRPLSILAEEPGARPRKRCLSRGTCLELFEMLEQALPEEPDPGLVRATGVAPRVCLKTGTSTGHHDAWTFVFNCQYVVGVWMGNSDGRPSNRLVGAEVALPLAAKMFRALEPANTPAWPEAGDVLHLVRVCAVSGLPASSWCERTRQVLLPRGQYLNRVCDMHYPSRGDQGILERWPGAAKGWDLAKISCPVHRRSESGEPESARRQTVRILDPPNRAEYVLTGAPGGDRVRLRTSVDTEAPLHWYLDDRYLGASNPDKPLLLALRRGEHALACMTSQGTLDSVAFSVAEPDASLRFATP